MGITPTALAIAGLAAGAVSTGIGVAGALQQSAAAAASARYNAQVAQQNASLAHSQGVADAYRVSQQGAQRLAMIRASLGANGVDVGSGSALDVQLSQAQTTGTDVATQRYNAALQAVGFRNQSQLDTSQAGFDQTAGFTSAAGTLFGGASQFASKWSSFQQSGGFGSSAPAAAVPAAPVYGNGVSGPQSGGLY